MIDDASHLIILKAHEVYNKRILKAFEHLELLKSREKDKKNSITELFRDWQQQNSCFERIRYYVYKFKYIFGFVYRMDLGEHAEFQVILNYIEKNIERMDNDHLRDLIEVEIRDCNKLKSRKVNSGYYYSYTNSKELENHINIELDKKCKIYKGNERVYRPIMEISPRDIFSDDYFRSELKKSTRLDSDVKVINHENNMEISKNLKDLEEFREMCQTQSDEKLKEILTDEDISDNHKTIIRVVLRQRYEINSK